jgi:hypothetical protein
MGMLHDVLESWYKILRQQLFHSSMALVSMIHPVF